MSEGWPQRFDAQQDLSALLGELSDGATIAFGGAGLQRKPMDAVRALAQDGPRRLRIVSVLGSLDVELLLAAERIAELHSAGVSLDGAGLAPCYRAARQSGAIAFSEWSEGTLLCSLEARARGLDSIPTWMGVGGDLPTLNEGLREGSDPFTGERVMQVRALRLDLAVIHVSAIDEEGNAYVDGDLAFDGALARAADRTVVTYETMRPAEPALAAISRLWIDAAIPAPRGAWPTGCHAHYGADLDAVSRWAAAGSSPDPSLLMSAEATR